MQEKPKNRDWVKNAAIIFLVVLLVLTFFSNTIMNRSLPEVATQETTDGSIVARVRGTGTVEANSNTQVKMEKTRVIRSVLVKVGQQVSAGDVLFTLGEGSSEDIDAAEDRLRELQTSYNRTAATMPEYYYGAEQNRLSHLWSTLVDAEKEYKAAQKALDQVNENNEPYKKAKKELAAAEAACDAAEATYKAQLKQATNNTASVRDLQQQQKDIIRLVVKKSALEGDLSLNSVDDREKLSTQLSRIEWNDNGAYPSTDSSPALTPPENTGSTQMSEDAIAKKAAEEEAAKKAQEAEEARKAQEAEEARKAQEAEEARKAQEAEEARKAQEAEEAKKAQEAEEAKKAQEAEEAKEAQEAEEAKKAQEAEEAKKAQEAEEAKKAQEAEEAKKAQEAEEAKKAQEAEEAKKAQEAEEAKKAQEEEEKRKAQEEEEKRKAKEEEEKRKAQEEEEKRKAKEEEEKRKAKEEEEKRKAKEEEEKKKKEEEEKRKAKEEEEKKKAEEEPKSPQTGESYTSIPNDYTEKTIAEWKDNPDDWKEFLTRMLNAYDDLQNQIYNNDNTLNAAREAYDAALADVEKWQTAVETMRLNNKNTKTEAYKTAKKNYEDAQEEYYSAKQSLDEKYSSNEATLAGYNIDLADTWTQIEKQKQKLADLTGGEEAQILSRVSGIVQTIDAAPGDTKQKDDIIATIEAPDMGYTLSFSVTNDQASRLRVGDTATVSNFYWGTEIVATLNSIKIDQKNPQTNKILTFDLSGNVASGTQLTLSVGSKSANYDIIVPSSAVRTDANGTFVYKLESKNSPLGNRYLARRLPVEVLASDDTNSALSADLSYGDYVITSSSSPLKNGQLVRLATS